MSLSQISVIGGSSAVHFLWSSSRAILILPAYGAMAKPNFAIGKPDMTMKRIATLAALTGAALLAQGCTQLRGHQGYVGDQTLLTSVQPGVDNKDSVQASLGRPTFTGQFGDSDWYYFARDTKHLRDTPGRSGGNGRGLGCGAAVEEDADSAGAFAAKSGSCAQGAHQ